MGFISHLRLRQFRNYESLEAGFPPGMIVLTGSNGQGKSNLLEAIHYLALLRSFRTRSAGELRRWGASYFCIDGTLQGEAGSGQSLADHRLSVIYGDRRRLRHDGKLIGKASANAFAEAVGVEVRVIDADLGLSGAFEALPSRLAVSGRSDRPKRWSDLAVLYRRHRHRGGLRARADLFLGRRAAARGRDAARGSPSVRRDVGGSVRSRPPGR